MPIDIENASSAISEQEIQTQFAEKAKSLGLTAPQLPFRSLCVDGEMHGQYEGEKTRFPSAFDEPEERLKYLGKVWCHQSTLEFIDAEGKYHIARNVEGNHEALKRAGYRPDARGTIFTNGTVPSGKAGEQFKAILNTPQDENERLRWAVRDGDLTSFNSALENGAEIDKTLDVHELPLIYHAINSGTTTPESNLIIKRLLQEKPSCAFHAAMTSPNSYVMHSFPEIIKSGVNPLALDSKGAPAFLCLSAYQADAFQRLEMITKAMLQIDGLTKKEKILLKAQTDFIRARLATGDKHKAQSVIASLRQAWEAAYREFPETNGEGIGMPSHVQSFLEPLTDPKRAPKFMEMLERTTSNELRDISDMVHEFTTHVVLPQALLDYHQRLGVPVTDDSLLALEGMTGGTVAALTAHLMPHVKEELWGKRGLDKIAGLSRAWHDPRVVFPDQLKPIKSNGEWPSLTGQKEHAIPELPGITIYVLTNPSELKKEGALMAHCVGGGGYATKCLEGRAHILSIRQEGQEKPLSTMEATWDGSRFTIIQNRAENNGVPSNEAKIAAEWFKDQLESGKIKPNHAFGETEESKRARARPQLICAIGAEITPESSDAAYREFCDNHLRRARKHNPKTDKFDLIDRDVEFIAGSAEIVVGVGEKGKPLKSAVSYKNLSARQWFEVAGLREKAWTSSPLKPLFEKEMENRRVQQEAKQARQERYAHSTVFDRIDNNVSGRRCRVRHALHSLLGGAPESLSQQAAAHAHVSPPHKGPQRGKPISGNNYSKFVR